MDWTLALCVALGGAIGAVTRYVLTHDLGLTEQAIAALTAAGAIT